MGGGVQVEAAAAETPAGAEPTSNAPARSATIPIVGVLSLMVIGRTASGLEDYACLQRFVTGFTSSSHELPAGFARFPADAQLRLLRWMSLPNSAERSTMSATEGSNRGRRRVLLIAAPFVAGAVVGAGVLTGSGSPAAPTRPATTAAPATAATSTNIAQTASQFDAETIYTRDSPGVVDITVTRGVDLEQRRALAVHARRQRLPADAGRGHGLRLRQERQHHHRRPRRRRRHEDHGQVQGRLDGEGNARRRRIRRPTRP